MGYFSRGNNMIGKIKINPVIRLTVILVLSACWTGADADDTEINYRLKWLLNTSVAGDIYADVHGLFEQQGLDVTVKPGGPERDAIKEIELGRAHFGVASADQIIRAIDKGAPIVVIAQLFQANPLQWIYRPNKTTVNRPGDLRGKIVGITYGGIDENIMNALMAKHHIESSQLTLYSVRYDFTPFFQGKVDLWPIYRNAQGPIIGNRLKAAGEMIDYFNPDAHGIRSVANSVITSVILMKNQPDLAKGFTRALLKGWELAINPDNTENTVETIHRVDKDTSVEIIREQLILTRKFIKPCPDTKIGAIDVPAWRETEEMMVRQGLISSPVGIEKHLKDLSNNP
jgi:NitT/TauT family transport system substrate-binding protein